MTIYYKTTKLTKALDYIRIHLSDGYSVSAYKSGIDYIVRVSGVEEVKDESQPDSEITRNSLRTDCNGCRFVGTYDTEFPCSNCARKNKDYYDAKQPDCQWK